MPGDGGSQIEAKLDDCVYRPFYYYHANEYFSLWFNQDEVSPLYIKWFADNMMYVRGLVFHLVYQN